ncbi:MAG: hypothetical protein FVQ83_09080 [Chloroflexi bacterium]|nr:hypothetical protein [Chloroflexota bacterium]
MTTHYDEKGKFFTDVISKETVPVIIQTITNRIHGMMHVRHESRLKDELNDEETFMAITNATIYDIGGKEEQYQRGFLAINRTSIVWLVLESEAEVKAKV